jgi:hypothetical protein
MRKDIYWVCVFKVTPEQFEEFKQVVAPLVARRSKNQGRSRTSTTSVTIERPSIFWSTTGIRMPLFPTSRRRFRVLLSVSPPSRP